MKRINENMELSNLPEKFSVRVHNEYQYDLLMNFFKTNQVVWNSGNIADEITFKSSFNYITYNHNGKKRLAYSTTKIGEEISLKDIISIKNLIPIRNKEVDPFEEEDWGYKIQESLEDLPEKFCVLVNNEEECRVLMHFFNSLNIMWIGGQSPLEHVYNERYPYIYFNYNNRRVLQHGSSKLPEIIELPLQKLINNNNNKYIPIRNKEVDPFEEEDWGYKVQESIENFDDMTKYVYQFNNIEECRIVANGLIDLGYSIFNYDKIMTDDDLERYNCFTWGRPFRRFSRGVIYHLDQVITFEEFSKMFLSGKKISRITNTEVDPFEEEDWGYRVQENKDTFDFRKYAINYDSPAEAQYIKEKLKKMGFNVTDGTVLPQYTCYAYYEKHDMFYACCVGSTVHGGKPDMSFREFFSIIENKKVNPIKNTEIDPFEEEDWGYTVQESLLTDLPERFCVHVENKEDFFILMLYFEGNNITWINGKKATDKDYNPKYPYLLFNYVSFDKVAKNKICSATKPSGIEIPLSVISDKRITKLRNTEVDPFEEEDWGYAIQESLLTDLPERFCVHIKNEEDYINLMGFFRYNDVQWISGKNANSATSRKHDPTYPYILFNHRHIEEVYGKNKLIASRESQGLEEIPVEKILFDKKYKKLKNDEIDPFEEEDWGYTIQENSTHFDFRDYAILFNGSLQAESIRFRLREMGYKVMGDTKNYHCYSYYRPNDAFVGCQRGSVIHGGKNEMSFETFIQLVGSKKINFIKNTEVDPFEEEDWGYAVQESVDSEFKVGDIVIVIDKLNYYIKKHSWNGKLLGLIGKKYRIDYIYEDKYYLNCKENYFVFEDCIQKVGEAKKNPEIDPYEEEDWDSIEESMDENLPDFTKYVIYYKTKEEFEEIKGRLAQMGFPVERVAYDRYFSCVGFHHIDKLFTPCMIGSIIEATAKNKLNFHEFMVLTGNGKKIIINKNTEVDPFEEEDWGYSLEESKRIKKIDFDEKG